MDPSSTRDLSRAPAEPGPVPSSRRIVFTSPSAPMPRKTKVLSAPDGGGGGGGDDASAPSATGGLARSSEWSAPQSEVTIASLVGPAAYPALGVLRSSIVTWYGERWATSSSTPSTAAISASHSFQAIHSP